MKVIISYDYLDLGYIFVSRPLYSGFVIQHSFYIVLISGLLNILNFLTFTSTSTNNEKTAREIEYDVLNNIVTRAIPLIYLIIKKYQSSI